VQFPVAAVAKEPFSFDIGDDPENPIPYLAHNEAATTLLHIAARSVSLLRRSDADTIARLQSTP